MIPEGHQPSFLFVKIFFDILYFGIGGNVANRGTSPDGEILPELSVYVQASTARVNGNDTEADFYDMLARFRANRERNRLGKSISKTEGGETSSPEEQ